ncbi:MAG: hypothetical protein E6G53_07435 [Actinobacteria bacterium]|nr:MAG: hypothetical protein E6G53_07435 [Actinomycetota bacterium]
MGLGFGLDRGLRFRGELFGLGHGLPFPSPFRLRFGLWLGVGLSFWLGFGRLLPLNHRRRARRDRHDPR